MTSDQEPRRRPPPFPQELLNRPKPKAVQDARQVVASTLDAAVTDMMIELVGVVQTRMIEAVGLLEIGDLVGAKALLESQIAAMDRLDMRPLSQR